MSGVLTFAEMENNTVSFVIEGKRVTLEENDEEVLSLLRNDDQFTFDFFTKAIKENRLEHFGIYANDSENIKIIRETYAAPESDSDSISNNISSEQETNSQRQGHTWTADATKLLLSLYQQYHPKVGKTTKLKNKKAMWNIIVECMKREEFAFTALQIENRFKTIDRGYKEKTVHNKKTGRNRASCEFERELTEINRDRRAVFPEFVLGSSGDGKKCDTLREEAGIHVTVEHSSSSFITEISETDTGSLPAPSSQSACNVTPRRKSNKSRTALDEIKKLRENQENIVNEKKEREATNDILKRKNIELQEAKLEAYKERTHVLKKRNIILEEYLKKKELLEPL